MMIGHECSKARLCSCSFGFALGLINAIFMLLLAWAGWLWGYGSAMIDEVASVFYGYSASFVGGLIGAAWGFVDGFIFGFLVIVVYNFCVTRCYKKSCDETGCK